jgi:hypothetical protein
MDENQRPASGASSVADELSRLGSQLAEALRLAWESDERRRLQAELTEGAKLLGEHLETAAQRARESQKTQQIKDQARRVADKIHDSNAVDDVRAGLVSGLEALNQEMGRLVERLSQGNRQASPPAPGSAGDQPAGESDSTGS